MDFCSFGLCQLRGPTNSRIYAHISDNVLTLANFHFHFVILSTQYRHVSALWGHTFLSSCNSVFFKQTNTFFLKQCKLNSQLEYISVSYFVFTDYPHKINLFAVRS